MMTPSIDHALRPAKRGALAAIGLALLAAGCTWGGASKPSDSAAFASVDCPAEVRTSTTRETKCGYLTVPENRSDPTGRQIRLFVFRMEPDFPTTAAPVVYVGDDLGSSFDYRATGFMAEHLDGPEVIGLEARGTGYSEPNLSCPEVEAIAPETLRKPIDDPHLRSAFVGAVTACHDRLVGQGIDLSSFGVDESGQDVIDLAGALGLSRWDVISKGSTSRIVFQAMRADPAGLRSVVLSDTPEFPDTDTDADATQSTRASFAELVHLCRADRACARRFPRLASSFDLAIERFDQRPVTVRISGVQIRVDGARLVRDLRNLLAGLSTISVVNHLPATIDALANAQDPASSLRAVVAPEITAPTFCTGYLPVCTGLMSQGAYYSALCRNIAPFANSAAPERSAEDSAAWTSAFVNGPYQDVCGAWDVAPADASTTAPVSSLVPTLVFVGGLDPFGPTVLRKEMAGLPNAFLLDLAVRSHPVGSLPPCPDDNPRNEFLAHPTQMPKAPCGERFTPTFSMSPL
jgi:pimeloyl-ACP methyl ester carboxylesterase